VPPIELVEGVLYDARAREVAVNSMWCIPATSSTSTRGRLGKWTSRTEATIAPNQPRSPVFRGFPHAPERTRTSTDHTVHKALNLVRLV
jgi:hypothetical protein